MIYNVVYDADTITINVKKKKKEQRNSKMGSVVGKGLEIEQS